jgi:uncharacterized hydrophobic protein (TIGR00271 family)
MTAIADTGAPGMLDEPSPEPTGPALLDALFPEGAAYRRSLESFFVLLGLAALIASFGLLEDSVAAIIGAMIVAPLGGAIMAFAGALASGRSRWQLICLLEVGLGSAMVVAIGFVLAWILPNPLTLNPSLEARTAPGLLDLGVALAAGAAGAYVAVRRTGADALPGVAIAVSLVPPLATVGICLALGRIEDAGGALILFLTNFSAIVVIAVTVFAMFGATPSREELQARHRLRNGFLVAIAALVLIALPLVWHGLEEIQNTIRSTTGAPIVRSWIGGRDLSVTAWSIDGDHVTIDLAGPDSPGSVPALANSLSQAIGAPIQLEVDYVQTERTRVTGSP